MLQCRKSLLAVTVATVALAGCLESGREGKNAGATLTVPNSQIAIGSHPVYNPIATQFPLPEDALFFINEVNDGTALDGTDPANPVTQGLGFLDGVSVLAPFDIKISANLASNQTLDVRSFIRVAVDGEGNLQLPLEEVEEEGRVIPNPNQNVFLLPLEFAGGDSLMTGEGEVPGLTMANDFRRAQFLEARGDIADANAIYDRLLNAPPVRVELMDIDGGSNNAVRILPESPLAAKTKYAVALSNDLRDSSGNRLVGSPGYQSISNPARVLANPLLQPFRDSALPSRQHATDFNQFKRSFFDQQEVSPSVSIPGFDDVVYSATFTTTAIEDVLLANASPVTFFNSSLSIELRQQEIKRLAEGFYNVSEQPLGSGASTAEEVINKRIFELLTDEVQEFRFFDEAFADRLIAARDSRTRLTFAAASRDSSGNRNRFAAFAMQAAVAQAAQEERGAIASDEASQLAEAAAELLNLPGPQSVRFYSERPGSDINPAFAQTGSVTDGLLGGLDEIDVEITVFEGEIELPYYQGIPADEMDGVAITGSNWSAADFGPNVNLPLAISDRITYRFPFAKQVGVVKVPILMTLPDQTVAGPPAGGYPVIIYQSALTQDRSATLTMALATGLLCAAEDTIANCFVTVAVDQPLHGIFPGQEGATSENGGMVSVEEQRNAPGAIPGDNAPSEDTVERHFGFSANADMQPTPASELRDQDIERESGSLFLNFTNFANTTDNMRQGAMDALNINASLANISAAAAACNTAGNCDNNVPLNLNRVYYLTHSFTGMGGAAVPQVINEAIAADNDSPFNAIQGQAFLNVGGHFSRVLENSLAISPLLLPGLDAASDGLLSQGRTELNLYLDIFQGLLDNVDPANYASDYAEQVTYLSAIVGNPADQDMDQPNGPLSDCDSTEPNRVTADCTIPVSADGKLFFLQPLMRDVMLGDSGTMFTINSRPMPLAGTQPLRGLAGASNARDVLTPPLISFYTEGSHGNPISAGQGEADPGSSEDVFTALAIQMMELFESGAISAATRTRFQNIHATDAGVAPREE